MQQLQKTKSEVTLDNMMLISPNHEVKTFYRKLAISPLTSEEIANIVFDMTVSSGSDLFKQALDELHDKSFAKFVENTIKDINYDLGYNNRGAVLARAKSIERAHNIIFSSKLKNREDQIGQAVSDLSGQQYQKFFSKRLTEVLGGFSKGFPCTVIGRPSHAKSTLLSYDSCWNVKHGVLNRVDWISPEEPSKIFWYRIFSHELKIDMNRMLHGLVTLSRDQVEKIRKLYEGKIHFHTIRTLQDLADLVSSLKSERIVIDHINAIAYPLDNQYSGIMSLVNFQKDYLERHKETVIVNLSQVNTKEMLKKGRLVPSPEDAYQSTILQQASREFLSIYYPLKDFTDVNAQKMMVGKAQPIKDGIQVHIGKNSFGEIGYVNLKFHPAYSSFEDYPVWEKGEIAPNLILGDLNVPDKKTDLFGVEK